MLRLFAALRLPGATADGLVALQDGGIPGARWIDPAYFHITLAFYGEVDGAAAHDLDVALAEINHAPFDISLVGVDAFGGNKPHLLYAKIETIPALELLAERCVGAARRLGIPLNDGKYRPHVTLARLKQAPPEKAWAWISRHGLYRDGPFPVRAFTLFSSHQGNGFSHYEPERTYALAAPAPPL